MKPFPTLRRREILAGALLASATAASAFTVPALASADNAVANVLAETDYVVVVQDGDWTRYNYKTELPNSTTEHVAGQSQEASDGTLGCHFRGTETEKANGLARDTIQYSREVANNLVECVMVIETATLTTKQAEKLGIIGDDEDVTISETEVSSSGGVTTNATTTGRYQKLYYEDPPQIDVTSVTARLRWTWTGSCTTWSSHQSAWGWFTFWDRTNYWSGNDYANCAYGATTSNTGQYKNGVFCATIDAWNEYYTNYVQGHSDGSIYYEWHADKWGGCVNLLSFHRVTGTW